MKRSWLVSISVCLSTSWKKTFCIQIEFQLTFKRHNKITSANNSINMPHPRPFRFLSLPNIFLLFSFFKNHKTFSWFWGREQLTTSTKLMEKLFLTSSPHSCRLYPEAGCREYVIRERDPDAKQLGGQYRVFKARRECNTSIARIRT